MAASTTATSGATAASSAPAPELVTATIEDVEVSVAKGTLVIRAAEQIGIAIPRFCDHPLLAPAGACRQCLVEVATAGSDGSLRAMPKPQAACTLEITRAWWSGRSTPRRSPRRRRPASSSCCWSTTRSTAPCATRAGSARCRTRR
jgi:hypothetical protein